MSRWFRCYDDLVDDPKVQQLPAEQFKGLINLWCLASKNSGALPPISEIAFKLRMKAERVSKLLSALRLAGLLEDEEGVTRPHNWNARQYKSDVTDPTAPLRQKAYRKRNKERDVDRNAAVTVARPETETETETERKKEEAPDGASSRYEFESGVIKLVKKDFDLWRASFSHLDLRAELIGLTQWAGEQRSWFNAVSGALAKRNREVKIAKEKQIDQPFKWNGMEGVL